jgi:Ion channel
MSDLLNSAPRSPVARKRYASLYKRRPGLLLISLLLFLVSDPVLEKSRFGGALLVVSLYFTLVVASMELSARSLMRWPPIILAGCSMLLLAAAYVHPSQPILIASWLVLTVFLGIAAGGLFSYLGQPDSTSRDRLSVSVSLYLLLGMLWFALFNLLEAAHHGSFNLRTGAGAEAPPGTLLYLSLATLTTLGYGDVVPITPIARSLASLEAVAGVLYVAITVARLVGNSQGYQDKG